MARKACHVFASTTQVGLIQALCAARHLLCGVTLVATCQSSNVRCNSSKARFGGCTVAPQAPRTCVGPVRRRSSLGESSPPLTVLTALCNHWLPIDAGNTSCLAPLLRLTYGGCITIRSSRGHFVARLNSGVRRYCKYIYGCLLLR